MIAATPMRPGGYVPHPCPSCNSPALYERKGRVQCAQHACGYTGNLPPDVIVVGQDTQRRFAHEQDGLS